MFSVDVKQQNNNNSNQRDIEGEWIHLQRKWLCLLHFYRPGPEVIKLFSCSTQLSMKFSPLINVKMPTIVGILTFMTGKNSILGISEPKNSRISWYLSTYEHLKFHAQLSWARKKFYNLGPCSMQVNSSRISFYQAEPYFKGPSPGMNGWLVILRPV